MKSKYGVNYRSAAAENSTHGAPSTSTYYAGEPYERFEAMDSISESYFGRHFCPALLW